MKKSSDLGKMVERIVEDAAKGDGQNLSSASADLVKMPKLALLMANYFNSLSKYCLSIHDSTVSAKEAPKKAQMKPEKQSAPLKINPLKKPLTAYILYYREKVPSFQEKYSNCTISQLTRLVAKEWSQLPESEKKSYIDAAAEDRKRYQKEKKEYKQRAKGQIPQQDKGSKLKKNKKKGHEPQSPESSNVDKQEKQENSNSDDSYISDDGV